MLKLWILSNKPRQGDVFQSMKQSRARFKLILNYANANVMRPEYGLIFLLTI